ncbi:hypothetical protein FRX31_016282 [Thalictrum thalictroides]|uniref:Reverse transcriptase zinc-binding domain-containing protein n=1 Tax=Thalictrum thalictroides TaxID=46969 RepID=A0A7J6WB72_THATH|nr:hypothetical protein FRX31_016282 [Thalictrum thalictroides]
MSFGRALWKGIMLTYPKFRENISCRLGYGPIIRFWIDNWIGDEALSSRFPYIFNVSNAKLGTVGSIGQVFDGRINWNFQFRRNLYDWEHDQLEELLQVLVQVEFTDDQDSWRWQGIRQGSFSVRSMYEKLIHEWGSRIGVAQPFPMKLVWRTPIAPNCKFFFWQVILGRVLTKDHLIHRGTTISPVCSLCSMMNETISHLFLHCLLALEVWFTITGPRRRVFTHILCSDSVEELLIAWPASLGTEIGRRSWSALPYAVIWVLWKIRNDAIFNSRMSSVDRICVEIKAYIWFWMANWQGRKNFFFQDLLLRWHEVILGLLIRGNTN